MRKRLAFLGVLVGLFALSACSNVADSDDKEQEPIIFGEGVLFQGRYLHKLYGDSSTLWIQKQKDGSIVALSEFGQEVILAVGDANQRPVRYSSARGPSLSKKNHWKFESNRMLQFRNWSDDQAEIEFSTDEGAIFDPNTRPDTYVAANILLRRFDLKPGEQKEFLMCDFGVEGYKQETFPSYRVRIEHEGKEEITVPAGTFKANHLIQTQLTPSHTWFKKRQGHVTEFWILDDYTILRILRHREPYEILLQEYHLADTETVTAATVDADTKATKGVDTARFDELLSVIDAPNEAQEVSHERSIRSQRFTYGGTVRNVTPNYSEQAWVPLERALEQYPEALKRSKEEAEELMAKASMADNVFGRINRIPVEGAVVTLKDESFTFETITDAEGHYQFSDLPPGYYDVTVQAEITPPSGVGPKRTFNAKKGIQIDQNGHTNYWTGHDWGWGTPDFEFHADSVMVQGRIIDSKGQPIAGAKVTGKELHPYNPQVGQPPEEYVPPHDESVSAADGFYVMRGFDPTGIGSVSAYLGGRSSDILNRIAIQVEYPSPECMPHVIVVPLVTEDLIDPARRIGDLMNRYVEVAEPNKKDRWQEREDVLLPVSHGNVIICDDIVLTFEKSGSISGRVLHADSGSPVRDFSVRVFCKVSDHYTPVQREVKIDASNPGSFSCEDLFPGDWTVEVGAQGYLPQTALVAIKSEMASPVTFKLERPGNISGLVLDAESKSPVSEFNVKVVHFEATGDSRPDTGKISLDENQKGQFNIIGNCPGKITLMIEAPGYARQKAELLVENGKTIEKTFHLDKESSLHGEIIMNGKSRDGQVSVHLSGQDMEEWGYLHTKEGRYEIKNLEEGDYTVGVSFMNEGGHATTWLMYRKRIHIGKGQDSRLDFNLDGNAKIRGVFKGPKALSERMDYQFKEYYAYIIILDNGLDPSLPEDERRRAIAYKMERYDGVYEISDLPAGSYTVIGMIKKWSDRETVPGLTQEKTLVLKDGQAAEVNFDLNEQNRPASAHTGRSRIYR